MQTSIRIQKNNPSRITDPLRHDATDEHAEHLEHLGLMTFLLRLTGRINQSPVVLLFLTSSLKKPKKCLVLISFLKHRYPCLLTRIQTQAQQQATCPEKD